MRRWACLALVLAAGAAPAQAQDYSFEVPRLELQVWVEPDASVRLRYEITFRNNHGARAIDVVDIGLPTADYDVSDMTASIDGTELRRIRPSQYVEIGVEVPLGGSAIPPGGEGTLRFECRIPDLVFQDTTRDDYASLRITPTWFGSRFVTGSGTTVLAIHLPEGVEPDEALHQGTAFDSKALFQERTVVAWSWDEPAVREHLVGVSFPKRTMSRVVTISRWTLLDRWLRGSPNLVMGMALAGAALFGLLYFRFTGGTGCCLFIPLLGVLLIAQIAVLPAVSFLVLPGLVAFVALNERSLRRKKSLYLPAIASVEGGGVKRGLTAPEAAALLELPLSRVLGLVIFGLLKKGIVRQREAEELTVELDPAFVVPAGRDANRHRREAARSAGTVFHKYEGPFLDVLQDGAGKPVAEMSFGPALQRLIERVAQRMRNFDLEETKAYYRYVVRRALREAERIGDIEQRRSYLDDNLEWVLMGDRPGAVTRHGGVAYWPRWHPAGGGGGGLPAPAAPSGSRTSLGDVAASFAGWAENTMGGLASAIAPGSVKVSEPGGGFVDLSALDTMTSDFFKALGESGGSGGGGFSGGGCACACAGCACACACAGGGR